ncbi:FAD-binding protein [Seongchinamella sediminis]|uniref:FAD-binding protein n=1 Tax=Seongchinamella sediminis TaxID=2283635 RepID=A0A3L7DV25_9GAMM|nr:FAD-binding oxidoreductase [Seongchinamella sediminis]RLQ20450.1 FAD-binding protein [Seongchinamella sediminis]
MLRRNFCRTAFASGAIMPLLGNHALASVYAGLMKVDRDLEALTRAGGEQVLAQGTVQSLADSLRGQLLLPGNAAYESARHVLNGSIDKHPALIVQPTGAADISSAVEFARDNDLIIAVKCGGHSYAGKSTCNGGMMIDLSTYRDVRIDLPNRSAFVTGGSLLGQLDHESMALGLVTTAGTVSHTGVGGLTTGGGFGRVGRRFGLALDNVKSVDVVSADGRLQHASAEENPDLYWAVRGGGGNFGVVTNFEFQLHPMERQVIGGNIVFPMAKIRALLEVYADYSPRSPQELYTDFIAVYPFGGKPGMAILDVCWSGDPVGYEKAIKPYLDAVEPIANQVKAVDYVALQRSGDSSDPRSWASYLKGGFVDGIRPGLIDAIAAGMEQHPDRTSILLFQHSGGAINQVAADATAFPHRYASHNMVQMVSWRSNAPRDEHVGYIRNLWSQLHPFTYGFYTVEVDDGHDRRMMNQNYQGNYARLAGIKKRYDPDNIFRLNANITPA